MPVSRQPPKRKVQLSLFLLPSTKIQTEPEYHLIGKILPLSYTWLQGCQVVCSQVQCRKSKAKIFQPHGKAGRNHSTAWSLQEILLCSVTAKVPGWSCILQRCSFSLARRWLGHSWDCLWAPRLSDHQSSSLCTVSPQLKPPRTCCPCQTCFGWTQLN